MTESKWLDAPDRPGWWWVCWPEGDSALLSVARVNDVKHWVSGWYVDFLNCDPTLEKISTGYTPNSRARWLPMAEPDAAPLYRFFQERNRAEEVARLKARLAELEQGEGAAP